MVAFETRKTRLPDGEMAFLHGLCLYMDTGITSLQKTGPLLKRLTWVQTILYMSAPTAIIIDGLEANHLTQ